MDIELVKKHWGWAAKLAAWLGGLIGVFLLSPPNLWVGSQQGNDAIHFTQFVLAILIGLFFFAPKSPIKTPGTWRWIALAALVAGVALFFVYQRMMATWTVPYVGEATIIGAEMPARAKEMMATIPGFGPEDVVESVLGQTDRLWPKPELLNRYQLFWAVYTGVVLCLSAAAMSMIEFLRATMPAPADPPSATPVDDHAEGAGNA